MKVFRDVQRPNLGVTSTATKRGTLPVVAFETDAPRIFLTPEDALRFAQEIIGAAEAAASEAL